MTRWVLLCLGLAACGNDESVAFKDPDGEPPTTTPPGQNESGSRIVAKTLTGEDGSTAFVGWRDSELEVDCSWRTASDGELRCLPGGPSPSAFADPECTDPLVLSSCQSTGYALVSTGPSCEGAVLVHRVGPAHNGATFVGQPGACVESTSVGPAFLLGEIVPAATFVRGTID